MTWKTLLVWAAVGILAWAVIFGIAYGILRLISP
jgi:hypothetical protein